MFRGQDHRSKFTIMARNKNSVNAGMIDRDVSIRKLKTNITEKQTRI